MQLAHKVNMVALGLRARPVPTELQARPVLKDRPGSQAPLGLQVPRASKDPLEQPALPGQSGLKVRKDPLESQAPPDPLVHRESRDLRVSLVRPVHKVLRESLARPDLRVNKVHLA